MVDITKTRTQLKTQALYELMLVENGQTADADNLAVVEIFVDPVVESLNSRGVIYVGDTENVPVEIFVSLAKCLAVAVAPTFGKQPDEGMRELAEDHLRIITKRNPPAEPYLKVDRAIQPRFTPMTQNRWLRGGF